jgi:2,3-bisphosphoglycerate-independent phosphoglycerate mutase
VPDLLAGRTVNAAVGDVRLPGQEVLVLRGEGLSGELTQTDPEREGVPPNPVRALNPESQKTADIVNNFIGQALAGTANISNQFTMTYKAVLVPGQGTVTGFTQDIAYVREI